MLIIITVFELAINVILFSFDTKLPDWYYSFSVIVYLFQNIYYLTKYKTNIFCFELFFGVSFFFCGLLYQIVADSVALLSTSFIHTAFSYNQGKAYILNLIGYNAYFLMLLINYKKEKSTINTLFSCNVLDCRFINYIVIIFIILFFLTGGLSMYTMYSDSSVEQVNRLDGFGFVLAIGIILCIVSIPINFSYAKIYNPTSIIKLVHCLPTIFILNTLFFLISFLVSGYRSNFLLLGLPLIWIYSEFFHKLSIKKILILSAAGFVVLACLKYLRTGNEVKENMEFIDYVADFVSANTATRFFIDYVDSHGITYGSNMLFQILAAIPFLQSIILLFIDYKTIAPTSSDAFTSHFDLNWGLGTSLIGDLYYSFGLFGVIALMAFLGWVISKLNKNYIKNIYYFTAYIVLLGNSVFAPRVEYFYIFRSIAWSLIFLYITKKICNSSFKKL